MMLTDLLALGPRGARGATLERAAHLARASRDLLETTAALLWKRPGAIRFDAPAAGNRRGRHGLWQRPLERLACARRRCCCRGARARWRSAAAHGARAARARAAGSGRALRAAGGRRRDIAAVTYGANPSKKGLDRVLAAWQRARTQRAALSPTSSSSLASAEQLQG